MFEKEMHAFTKINLNFSTLLTGKTSQSTGSKNLEELVQHSKLIFEPNNFSTSILETFSNCQVMW